ncbi:unnamed protein product [Urochloa humidicola]
MEHFFTFLTELDRSSTYLDLLLNQCQGLVIADHVITSSSTHSTNCRSRKRSTWRQGGKQDRRPNCAVSIPRQPPPRRFPPTTSTSTPR